MAVHAYTALINTANTDISGVTGTHVSLVTGSAAGTIIDEITINAVVTTTAGMIRMYIDVNGAGTNLKLHSQIPVTAVVPSATSPSWNTVIRPLNLKLHSGQKLSFTTEKGETFHLTASVTEL